MTRICVKVDPDLCVASGHCLASLPEVFSAAPDGIAEVSSESPDPGLLEQLREAEAACPSLAISVVEE